jgi:tRNA 2-selenouridine synthase
MRRPDCKDYLKLFLKDVPLFDVRAPIEFNYGALPGSVNLPILDDDQREQVGIVFKKHGQVRAIALGETLATPEIRAERISRWMDFVRQHPEGYLFCLRGGMRSQIAQDWLAEKGVDYPRVIGGYKAIRAALMETIPTSMQALNLVVLSGRTGTGKTHLLPRLSHPIDLEGLAGHRGSSFGKRVGGQPAQATFEHGVAVALLRAVSEGHSRVVVEDESRLIGRRSIPSALFDAMTTAPIVVLEAPMADRVSLIVSDYVNITAVEYQRALGDEPGWVAFSEVLHQSLDNIRRRLGDARHGSLTGLLSEALTAYRDQAQLDGFRAVVGELLEHYYDPMYDYQLNKKTDRVLFRGEAEGVVGFMGSVH